jgi:hypothetical protein
MDESLAARWAETDEYITHIMNRCIILNWETLCFLSRIDFIYLAEEAAKRPPSTDLITHIRVIIR